MEYTQNYLDVILVALFTLAAFGYIIVESKK